MWLFQITVAAVLAADRPEIILEPYQVLDLLPRLARLKPRAEAAGMRMVAGNNVGYFGFHATACCAHTCRTSTAGRAGRGDGCSVSRRTVT